jgi:hypothetical protein
MCDENETVRAASPAAAATRRLKDYWKSGEGAARIRWGTRGDLTRCHDLVSRAAGVASAGFDAWGFCNNIHKEKFGRPNDPDD